MATILKGAEVTKALNERIAADAAWLREQGVIPSLAIVRVGAREDDISYERGAIKRCENNGVSVRHIVLPETVTQEVLVQEIETLNADSTVHGILLFQPLPKHLDGEAVRKILDPQKDVDGITDGSLASIFSGSGVGFAPCTAQACMEILDHFQIDCTGKHAVVIGRSLVVGKPAAVLLLGRNATVTVCHTRTVDMPAIARKADILLVAAGKAEVIGREYLSEGQIVLDVGIHVNSDGTLCGDVCFEEAEPIVSAITPVPGGVGTVTTSVLVSHVVQAAKRSLVCCVE
ncbi:MAG: bifunctional 5,10-methylenetetrahydrofolate dehydrogenase/5,10-methenyltetrahydrofolate cyclohydrolase [Oscillospiraceae bacterium]|jgi:methylenetetrahydrofolate dehydrogenase (NADP+)/methenyltetrahydrofolate cyclohydrolase